MTSSLEIQQVDSTIVADGSQQRGMWAEDRSLERDQAILGAEECPLQLAG
jgi:hypothetical protein